ncbi:DHH family phosphoesterase [Candidatus Micrarchaeota archaeon]|nr:DHH family phosphoesterase [Candidatus Micrarchaeota archaeon]
MPQNQGNEESNSKDKALFEKLLAKYGKAKVVIATHNRADVDAISSSYSVHRQFPNSILCTREEMTEGAKMLCAKLGIEPKPLTELNKNNFSGILVVDTSAYTLVPDAKNWPILGIIDHHRADGRDIKGEFEIIDEQSPSAAEIVANILDEKDIDENMAFALSIGIIADGARFKSARAQTFETLARLIKISKTEYAELLSYAEPGPKDEAKIAILKAMQKLNYVYASGYIIATSEGISNESDSASLITEAADVAFIAKWKDETKETRISARARGSVMVPLNEVMSTVAKRIGGAGGGHPKAAGAAVKCHTDEALKRCVGTFIELAEKQEKINSDIKYSQAIDAKLDEKDKES